MSISERFAANTAALTSLEQTVNGSLTGLGDRVTDLEANTVTDAELATQLANRPTIAEMNAAIAAGGGGSDPGGGDPGGGDPGGGDPGGGDPGGGDPGGGDPGGGDPGGGGSSATADAVIAGFSGSYDSARQAAITNMITSIEGAGIGDIWAKIHMLLMFASPSSVDALINWKTGQSAVLAGSGVNTPDQGFQLATGHVLSDYALQETDHSNWTFLYWGANGGTQPLDSFTLFANYEQSINVRMAVVDGSTDLAFSTGLSSRTRPRLPGMTMPARGGGLAFTGGASYIAVGATYNGFSLSTYSRGTLAQTESRRAVPAYDFSAVAVEDRKLQLLSPQSNSRIQDPDSFCIIIAELLTQEEITAVHNAVDAYLTSIGAIA